MTGTGKRVRHLQVKDTYRTIVLFSSFLFFLLDLSTYTLNITVAIITKEKIVYAEKNVKTNKAVYIIMNFVCLPSELRLADQFV